MRSIIQEVFWRSRYGLTLLGFSGIAAFFLFAEHRAHALGGLPYVLLLLCLLLHFFGHGGHGGHGEEAEKGMEGMDMPGVDRSGKATHHLLLYLRGADGKSNPPAKVGFQITASDGSTQKTLTMEMEGRYGADVVLPAKGPYRVETKIDLGTATLNDGFSLDRK